MNKIFALVVALVATITLGFPDYATAKNGKKATRRTPLGEVHPRITQNYKTGPFSWKSTEERVAAYKQCMFPDEGRLERALTLNLAVKDSVELFSDPRQLAYEVCLADAMGLPRYEDQVSIEKGKQSGSLVELSTEGLVFSDALPSERRYGTPWVKNYVEGLATEMKKKFNGEYTPLRVGSLVRSFKDQLRQRNSPASCKTEICSSHTTGSAVDLSNVPKWSGDAEREWLRARLVEDRKLGKIVVIEEKHPQHFHVLVIPPEFVPSKKE